MQLKRVLIILILSIFVLVFTHCTKLTEPNTFDATDGNSGFVASEVNDMGDAVLDFNSFASAKSYTADNSTSSNTVSAEIVITPWHYENQIQGFVREAECTYPAGERTRRDTAYFYDADKNKLNQISLQSVDSIVHKRTVQRARNENQTNINFCMNIKINKSATDTTAVKNGSSTGTYNGNTFKNLSVQNVTRKRIDGNWLFPESGTISINRPLRTIDIEFKGNGSAEAVIERKRDKKQIKITIDVETGEEY